MAPESTREFDPTRAAQAQSRLVRLEPSSAVPFCGHSTRRGLLVPPLRSHATSRYFSPAGNGGSVNLPSASANAKNRFFTTSLHQPISTLTVQVYTYANSPYQDWHRQAWAGALVLVTLVLTCSVTARIATRRLERLQGH